jgi:hypothetical protein
MPNNIKVGNENRQLEKGSRRSVSLRKGERLEEMNNDNGYQV